MSEVNATLIQSVLWDLKDIVDTCGEIESWTGRVNCKSWRYPSERSDHIDVSTITEESLDVKQDQYVLLLELVYDRIYFLLNLMMKFLNSIPITSNTLRVIDNVREDYENIPFGVLVKKCWRRISIIHHQIMEGMLKQESLKGQSTEFSNTTNMKTVVEGTQTEVTSLVMCENCYKCEQFIRRLTTDIEKYMKDYTSSAVTQHRLLNKDKINTITQWKAMDEWISAILQDVQCLSQNAESGKLLKVLQKKYETNEKCHEKEVMSYKNQIRQLMNKINEIERAQKSDNNRYLNEVEKLKNELTISRDENEKIKENLKKSENERLNLLNEMRVLEENIQVLWPHLQSADEEMEELKSKVYNLCNICEEKEIKIAALEKQLAGFNELQVQTNKDNIFLPEAKEIQDNKLVQEDIYDCSYNNKKSNEALLNEIQDLKKKLQEAKTRQSMLLQYPDLNGTVRHYKCKGSPIEDMEGQLAANTCRIELLKQENIKLQQTLMKLYRLAK